MFCDELIVCWLQIPASLASSSAELRERACQLVMTGAVKDIVSEAMAGVLSSVEDLLNLAKCDHDHEAAGAETKPTPVGPLARVVDLGWPRGKRRCALYLENIFSTWTKIFSQESRG